MIIELQIMGLYTFEKWRLEWWAIKGTYTFSRSLVNLPFSFNLTRQEDQLFLEASSRRSPEPSVSWSNLSSPMSLSALTIQPTTVHYHTWRLCPGPPFCLLLGPGPQYSLLLQERLTKTLCLSVYCPQKWSQDMSWVPPFYFIQPLWSVQILILCVPAIRSML